MKKFFIVGGTGFIGSNLLSVLSKENYQVYVLVRSEEKAKKLPSFCKAILGDPTQKGEWQKKLNEADITINFAGQNIFGRWNKEYKKLILESRIKSTENVINSLKEGALLVNASAIGYYGNKGNTLVTEDSLPGDDFLAKVCIEWEKKALEAKERGGRVIITRFGIVLGNGGMLSKILPLFKWGLGGTLGRGNQWFSWIHIEDLVSAILFLIENEKEGVYNLTSPKPVTNKEFTKTLGKILKRPTLLPVPIFAIKLLFGDLAKAITSSVKVYPKRLLELGFSFKFDNIESALRNLIEKTI
ncbi:MAG: TIGR01777 family protein [Thermodesulfobacterium geofontis]|uniref:TIGR01777 family protein n=1 Tax=Thermodesulfobacterium geofontis TaxID=1295609 RepID=A0A2N7QGL0_9BACT|nr:MAG: TIGR01777 family protein [Thermodesulfobacterium geofontis]PMP98129.1 MAG: TIGR01777 family protein [Thermodesulfobacterium geofontis]